MKNLSLSPPPSVLFFREREGRTERKFSLPPVDVAVLFRDPPPLEINRLRRFSSVA